jgi:Bacteriophage probable baseplate hub protein
MASILIDHIDQTNESDANFITRIAAEHDALASIKEGHLLFIPNGNSKTASGNNIPSVEIKRSAADSHNYTETEREKYTGVQAKWQNAQTGQLETVISGTTGTVKTLPKTYPTQQEAKTAAQGGLTRTTRGKAQINLKLAIGNPALITETPVTLTGYKQQIDTQNWIVKQVTHTLNDSGLTSSLQLENR